jgi:N-acyl homoserine lactone hydrolase
MTAGIAITTLRLAEVVLPSFHPEAPGSDTIHGFLVRDGGAFVLVDTGVGTGSRLIDKLYEPDRVELPTALAAAGASLSQITAIVNSHLHFDHCGNNALFPDIPIFVQRAELDAARQPDYTVPDWVDFPGARYVPVDGRHKISEHLELIPTPGHTPGHQSLVVHSPDGVDVVVAQAAYTGAEFDCFRNDPEGPAMEAFIESNATWSKEPYLASVRAIEGLGPRRAFFSHDPVIWERD